MLDTSAGRECTAVGALVQANYGRRADFVVRGVPVGTDPDMLAALRADAAEDGVEKERGSIIVVIGTDAPLMPHQLNRLARRAAIGIGRGGSPGGNNSGDIFLAFSTANSESGSLPTDQFSAEKFPTLTLEYMHDDLTDTLYLAAVQAVEEAILNAMCAAEDMSSVKPAGAVIRAIPHDALQACMRNYGRLNEPAKL